MSRLFGSSSIKAQQRSSLSLGETSLTGDSGTSQSSPAAVSGTKIKTMGRRKTSTSVETLGRSASLDIPTLSPNEANQIRSKLDSLAGSQNPLLGLDLDEAATPTTPVVTSGSRSVFVRKLAIHSDLTRSNDGAGGPFADMFKPLPPKASADDHWNKRVMDIKHDTFLPVEFHLGHEKLSDRAEIARQELDVISQNLSRLEDQVRQLVQEREENPNNQDKYDREGRQDVRKCREEIQAWELKHWKASSTLDRELHAASKEVEEKDGSGNVIKTYMIKDGRQLIASANKETLVSLLLEESNADVTFVDTFLLAYILLLPPSELLDTLFNKFQKMELKSASIVLRIFAVLKRWVEIGWVNDFQLEGLEHRFRDFTEQLAQTLRENGSGDKTVDLAFLSTFIASRSKTIDVAKRLSVIPTVPEKDKLPSDEQFFDACMDVEIFSKVMAQRELEIYAAVPAKELVDKLVTPNTNEQPSPKLVNVNHFISWINQMGYWVTNLVISQPDLKRRIRIVAKLIDIAQECTEIKCFNTVFSIVTGLSSSSVSRLNQTWTGLGKKTVATWRNLEQLCNPQGNYKQYRLMEANAQPPFIPFFAMHLRDMLFTHDGNPSKLPNGLYNFAKLRMILERAEKVLAFQKKTFYTQLKGKQYEPIGAYVDMIMQTPPLDERHLYKLSTQLEPPAFRAESTSTSSSSSSSSSGRDRQSLSVLNSFMEKAI